MEIAELKLKVLEKLIKIEDEDTLLSILDRIKNKENEQNSNFKLTQHFESITNRFDSTLKKLAQ